MSGVTELDALQAALAAEHAAVYGYGVISAFLAGSARKDATLTLDQHRARRDRLRTYIVDAKATPVESEVAYKLPADVTTVEGAKSVAARLEQDVAVVYGDLVVAGSGGVRSFAAQAIQDLATRQYRFQGTVPRFPGLPTTDALASPVPTA